MNISGYPGLNVDTVGQSTILSSTFSTGSSAGLSFGGEQECPPGAAHAAPALTRRHHRIVLSTFPQPLLLLLMFYIKRSRRALPVNNLRERPTAQIPVTLPANIVGEKTVQYHRHISPFTVICERLQEALWTRAFALQGTGCNHIMTAEGEPCRRRRITSRLRIRV